MLKKNWNKTEKCGVVSDGKAWLHVQADDGIRLQWTDLHGKGKKYEPDQYFSIAVTLSPGECRSIQVVQRFHCLEENVPSFDEALPAAQSMWQHFEDEVHVVPNTALTKIQGVYHHLIAQCLQMAFVLLLKKCIRRAGQGNGAAILCWREWASWC